MGELLSTNGWMARKDSDVSRCDQTGTVFLIELIADVKKQFGALLFVGFVRRDACRSVGVSAMNQPRVWRGGDLVTLAGDGHPAIVAHAHTRAAAPDVYSCASSSGVLTLLENAKT